MDILMNNVEEFLLGFLMMLVIASAMIIAWLECA